MKRSQIILCACLCAAALVSSTARARKIRLDFDRADLVSVLATFAKLDGRNYIVPDALRDLRFHIVTGSPVELEQAQRALDAALASEGLVLVERQGFWIVQRTSSPALSRPAPLPARERSLLDLPPAAFELPAPDRALAREGMPLIQAAEAAARAAGVEIAELSTSKEGPRLDMRLRRIEATGLARFLGALEAAGDRRVDGLELRASFSRPGQLDVELQLVRPAPDDRARSALAALRELLGLLAPFEGTRLRELHVDGPKVRLRGMAATFEECDSIVAALKAAGFAEIKSRPLRIGDGARGVRFVMWMERRVSD
ncbi:MAG: hypothetical protein JXR96_20225 [Deltaproteobacteria bacterium]|nr:hypothetical protein [Deltaproteobacteria bacterium]